MERKVYFMMVLLLMMGFQSCSVSTKNKRHTVAIVECYDKKLFDIRKKYEKRQKDIEQRNRKRLRDGKRADGR